HAHDAEAGDEAGEVEVDLPQAHDRGEGDAADADDPLDEQDELGVLRAVSGGCGGGSRGPPGEVEAHEEDDARGHELRDEQDDLLGEGFPALDPRLHAHLQALELTWGLPGDTPSRAPGGPARG